MADNVRSHRSRDALARGEFDSAVPDASGDPLAELARLIGQSDANGEGGRQERYEERYETDRYEADGYAAPAAANGAANAGLDWAADEDYAEQSGHGQGRYPAPPPPAASHPAASSPVQGYEDEPPAGPRFFSGPAAAFNGFREDEGNGNGANADYAPHSEQPSAPAPGRRALPFGVAPREQPYPAAADEHDGGHDYAPEDYDDEDETPRRRSGLVVVMAVLGLAVIGTAGAFGYRAMFGGSVLPQLPPIIKANSVPNKIVPTDAPAANPGQPGAAGAPPALAPPPEQPVDLNKTAPRVVSTIPVGPGASPASPIAPISPPPAPALPAAVAPPAPALAAPVPPPAAQASAEPKKVHTVQIHADQPTGNAAPPAAPPPRRQASVPSAPPPPRGNAPLSIVPGGGGDAAADPAPPRSHAAAPPARAPLTVASAGPAPAPAAGASGGGGYAVQVSSQRSEAEAKSSFQALRAKFPKELGGREPIVRRADLGDKGIYYRALVGPFASMEEAAGLCSSLKAAGGNCLIQRN
jgi:hypothetical protein